MPERPTNALENRSEAAEHPTGARGAKFGLEVAVWALFLSLALNTVSAALVPLASQDNSLTIARVRVADLLVVLAVTVALFRGVPRGGFAVWGVVAAWAAWSAFAVLELGAGEFSPYRGIAEWQAPVYLAATWLVLNTISGDRLSTWARRTVRCQIGLIVLASAWAAFTGRAGADIATIGCVIAMLALAVPRITSAERAATILAALLLVLISGQRAALLLSLIPLAAATGIWSFARLGRERLSTLFGTLLLAVSVVIPLLLAGALDPDIRQQATDYVQRAFFREAKQLSVDSRFVQWEVGVSDLMESPLVGQGVGGTVIRFRDPGIDQSATSNITHNSALDFALRFGAPVGGLLIILLVALVVGRMVEAWKYGYFGLWICAWAVAGLLAKGMVESVFFKPRLVPLLAVLIAVLILQRSLASAVDRTLRDNVGVAIKR